MIKKIFIIGALAFTGLSQSYVDWDVMSEDDGNIIMMDDLLGITLTVNEFEKIEDKSLEKITNEIIEHSKCKNPKPLALGPYQGTSLECDNDKKFAFVYNTEKIAHVFVAECQTKSKCSYVGEQIEKILKEKLKHD